jgi:hypothetical protein
MKIKRFENLKIVLSCGVCGACPAVNISAEGVSIGEDNNTVRLTHAQWNDLVYRIQKGELSSVE